MQYEGIAQGTFVSRATRFTAQVALDGQIEACHLKSTARMRELLVPGAATYVQHVGNASRVTACDVIAVRRGDGLLVNIDSLAPNKVFREWALAGGFMEGMTLLKSEAVFGHSRFDFYMEGNERAFIEVKGVTLEKDGLAFFPDAPTERGLKHVEELIRLKQEGMGAHLVFVVQMKGPRGVTANRQTHEAFYQALLKARDAGVGLHAVDCIVTGDTITADKRLPILL